VLADGPNRASFVAILAHPMRYVPGFGLGWQPTRYQFSWHILTGLTTPSRSKLRD
jgi:hypothetical protein